MGVQTTYLQMYLPADNELFDEQLNTNTSLQKVDAGIQVEHNGWTAHAAAPSPHTGHAVFTANTFTGQQTVRVAADAPAMLYDPGALVANGVQTGERVIYRANSYDGVNHQRSFMWRARTTTNAGGGVFELLTTLDAQAPPTVLQSIDQAGNMSRFGTQTYTVGADIAGIVLDPGVLAAAGTQMGERVVYRAHSFDAVDHFRDFIWRPRTTTNAGGGIFELLTLIDGGGQAVVWSVDQAGNVVGSGGFTGPSMTITGAGATYSGVGARILGDMSSATLPNRLAVQTSTANGGTTLHVIPNGTGVASSMAFFANSSQANVAFGQFGTDGSSVYVSSSVAGTATYLPMIFYTGGAERARLTTTGQLLVGTTSSPGTTVAVVGNMAVQSGSTGSDASFTVMRSNGNRSFLIDGSGTVFVNPDGLNLAAGSTLIVKGVSGQYGLLVQGYNLAAQSYGLRIAAGSSAGGSDIPLEVGRYDASSLFTIDAYGNVFVRLGKLAVNVSSASYPLHVGGYAQITQGLGLYGQVPTAGYPLAFTVTNPVVPLVFINTAGIAGGMFIEAQGYGGDPHSNYMQFITNNGAGSVVNTLWLNGYGHVSIGNAQPGSTIETWLNLPSQIGDQLFIYPSSAGSNYGFGINSGELNIFCAAGQNVAFRNGSYNATRTIVFATAAGTATFNGAVTQNASWAALKSNRAPVPDDSIDRAMAWVRDGLEPVRFRLKANRYDPPTSHPVHGDSPAFGHDYDGGYEHVGFTMDDMPEEIRKMITANDTGGICLGDMDGFLLMLVRRLAQQVQNLERLVQTA